MTTGRESGVVGAVLQARLGSTRLPGKMLRDLCGMPLVDHVVERLGRARSLERIVVAIPEGGQDDALAAHCLSRGWDTFRGSEDDVLGRYAACARAFGLDHIVRATGDTPLVDPEEVDRLVRLHLEEGADYSSSKDEVGSRLPNGTGLEMFTRQALERSDREGRAANHREHINEYIVENPGLFNIASLPTPAAKEAPHIDVTVDTAADFAFVERFFHRFAADHERMTTQALIAFCREEDTCAA